MQFHLYVISKVVKATETVSRTVIARSWKERETGSCCSMGTESQFWKMKSFRDAKQSEYS